MPLPEYLTEQTEEAIRQRMFDSLPADLDTAEGSYLWDSLSPAAIELVLAALWAQEVLRRGFASTAASDNLDYRSEYLDLRCEERGITRNPAVKATGQARFTGTAGTVVPIGTKVAAPANSTVSSPSVEFVTTEEVTISESGEAAADLEAAIGGISGNVPTNAVSILTIPVPGVTGVTNPQAITGGAEIENDQSLLARYLARCRTPGMSANDAQYKEWALEIPGVGGCYVQKRWAGPSTIKLYLIDTNKLPAGPDLVGTAQAIIDPVAGQGEGKAPIDHFVTCAPGIAVPVNITAAVDLDGTRAIEQVKSDFETSVTAYLKNIAYTSLPNVRIAQIGNLLFETQGLVDYSELLLNGAAANVTVEPGHVAVCGTVTLSE